MIPLIVDSLYVGLRRSKLRVAQFWSEIKIISIIQKIILHGILIVSSCVQLNMLTWLDKASSPVDHEASLAPKDT